MLTSPPVSPFHSNMGGRKRKADDDGDEMSMSSPVSSPAISSRQLARPSKRVRPTEVAGRQLTIPRLLETLEASQLRTILQTICERHPDIAQEVVASAPPPLITSTLNVLAGYQDRLRQAFPYGTSSSAYTYDRIRQPLVALVEAIAEFTPQYLPPVETQNTVSFQFLDGVTKIIHQLPDWDSTQYRLHKENAYEDIARAWALVITEAAKRGGGFMLHSTGWHQVLEKHNQQSGGRLEVAMHALATHVGWVGSNNASSSGSGGSGQNSLLQQLMSGTYGAQPVQVSHF